MENFEKKIGLGAGLSALKQHKEDLGATVRKAWPMCLKNGLRNLNRDLRSYE